MGASASQIASAKALAKSRGYDPNLVDEDNADRANTAFPPKGPSTSAPTAVRVGPVSTSPPAGGQTPPSAPTTPGGTVPDVPSSSPTSGAMTGLSSALTSQDTSDQQSQPAEQPGSGLRQSLGNRMYPVNSAALAGLQRAY